MSKVFGIHDGFCGGCKHMDGWYCKKKQKSRLDIKLCSEYEARDD